MTVNQILSAKGNQVFSIAPTITVYEAIKVMGELNIGAVLVIEGSVLKGILSERDYARKVVLENKTSKKTFVYEIMESNVVTVSPTEDLDDCMNLMSSKRIRHLPVVDKNRVIGIVSIGDVVKTVIEKQKETIEFLDSYITGTKAS